MQSDLEIARAAEMEDISAIAWKLGIGDGELMPMGTGKAKITWQALKNRITKPQGSLILVTSVNPTPFGEGKTVTTIGLTQALNRIGKRATCVIREPSMGPVFGIKGGAAGGGLSQVLPMEDINLHFTGDLHAVTSAHNLLSSMIDNHLKHGNEQKIDSARIIWPRVVDLNDRSLRNVTVGLGGPANGIVREDRFDITAASEVMAILSLASDYEDLRLRLGRIIVAENYQGEPITADDIEASGAMALLLRDAFLPNLVQTLEGNPAFVHCGPFANIAHGNSSVIADKIALSCADYVVTEAGFGAEMGAQKALHIKSAASGVIPSCIVLNVTIRSMKLHGGGFSTGGGARPSKEEIELENIEAVRQGASTNLRRHVRNLSSTQIPVIVSINKFSTDTVDEINILKEEAIKAGASNIVIFEGHEKGGKGAIELANAVVNECKNHDENNNPFSPIVDPGTDVEQTILKIATNIYGAQSVDFSTEALHTLKNIKKWNKNNLPVCMAKNQYSFSHDKKILGAPSGFNMPIRELRINAGAGFIVAVCGSMMTMPGLPKRPAAADMDMDEDGNLTGVFG